MRSVTLEELDGESVGFDALVDAMAGIDHFCSSTEWILPAACALMPDREPWVHHCSDGYVALMRSIHPQGLRILEPLEAMWGLGCPLASRDPERLAGRLCDLLVERERDWDVALISGLVPGSPLQRMICSPLGERFGLARGPGSVRHVADLVGTVDEFCQRRGRGLRRTMQRARSRARDLGVSFEDASQGDPKQVYARILAVERSSWKGRARVGIQSGPMSEFYRLMLERLAGRGGQRILFGRLDGRDVAYILGAVRGRSYRGLQFSYAEEVRHLSLGNLCQLEQMTRLESEGIESYDLGAAGPQYKERWSDREFATETTIVFRAQEHRPGM